MWSQENKIWTSLGKELRTEEKTLHSPISSEPTSTSVGHFEQVWQSGPFLLYKPLVKQEQTQRQQTRVTSHVEAGTLHDHPHMAIHQGLLQSHFWRKGIRLSFPKAQSFGHLPYSMVNRRGRSRFESLWVITCTGHGVQAYSTRPVVAASR